MKTTLALLHLQNKVDSALAGITGGPGLSGHGVRGVTVSTQTLAVNPSLGNSIGGLLLSEAEHLRDDGSSSNLDKDDVVEANLVVGVLEGQNTLNLVGLDHGLEHVANLENLAIAQVSTGTVSTGDPVSDGQNTAEVVGGVTPLGCQPAVIVVEPADHGTNVESTIDGVKLVRSTGHAGSIGDHGAFDDGTKELGALLELEGLKTTS